MGDRDDMGIGNTEPAESQSTQQIAWVAKFLAGFLAGALLCALVPITGCSSAWRQGDVPKSVARFDDVETAERILPSLEGIESVDMEQVRVGGTQSRDLVPGPADYVYQGYVTLSDEAAEGYAESYDLHDGGTPQVELEAVEGRDGRWLHDHDLCEDLIKGGLFGDVWLDGNTMLVCVYTT